MNDRDEALCPVCGAALDLSQQGSSGLVKCDECLQHVQPEYPEGQ
jgi:predicted amidophosphoribosyltransferase